MNFHFHQLQFFSFLFFSFLFFPFLPRPSSFLLTSGPNVYSWRIHCSLSSLFLIYGCQPDSLPQTVDHLLDLARVVSKLSRGTRARTFLFNCIQPAATHEKSLVTTFINNQDRDRSTEALKATYSAGSLTDFTVRDKEPKVCSGRVIKGYFKGGSSLPPPGTVPAYIATEFPQQP